MTLLDAGYGNDNLCIFRNENAQVQDAVLLGTYKFLPVEEEDRFISVVQEFKAGHRARPGNFRNAGCLSTQRFIEGKVIDRRFPLPHQGKHR